MNNLVNKVIIVVMIMALGTMMVAQSGPLQDQNPTGESGQFIPEDPGATVDITYMQADDVANGAPAQIFEAAYSAYDGEMADDFIIPPGLSRSIVSFQPVMTSSTGLINWNGDLIMTVYADAGGSPGAVVFTETFPTPPVSGLLTSTSCPPLTPGTYWIGVQVDQDFGGGGGQSFWSVSTQNTAGPGLHHWRNPGDGFGTGCTDWGEVAVCGVGGGAAGGAQGAAMVINLSEEIEIVPTMGEWGIIVLSMLLLILGTVAVSQREPQAVKISA